MLPKIFLFFYSPATEEYHLLYTYLPSQKDSAIEKQQELEYTQGLPVKIVYQIAQKEETE